MSEHSLINAIEVGDLEEVKLLISRGVNVNEKDNSGWTPLHFASRNGHLEVMKLLISEAKSVGIDIVNEKNNSGCTPLQSASANGHLGVMKLLISEGADYQELMEECERKGQWDKREELERIVIDIAMTRVKMI